MRLRRKRLMNLLIGFLIFNVLMMSTRIMKSWNKETTSYFIDAHRRLKTKFLSSRLHRGSEDSARLMTSTAVTSAEDGYGACRENFDWAVLKRSNTSSSLTSLPRADPCCLGRPGSIFLLILVTSSPRQFKIRRVLRRTWGGVEAAGGGRSRVLVRFLLGRVIGAGHSVRTQSSILTENSRHGDIIQGDFEDVYRNLTLKTISGMDWAARYCPAASYVMKTDSDVYVNIEGIVRYLSNSSRTHHRLLAVGDVTHDAKPIRNPVLKWYTTEAEYPFSTYPPFMKGPGYILSSESVRMLIRNFSKTPVFVWEDVYVGMCLRNAGIVPTADERFETWGARIDSGCDVAHRFVIHGVRYYHQRTMWRIHRRAIASGVC